MGLPDVIADLGTGTYTVWRTAEGAYVAGRYAAGAASSFEVVACVQPVTGWDLKNLPEAQHAEETKVIYCATELRTRTTEQEPDRIVIDGAYYEIFRVEKWEAFGDTHWRAYAAADTADNALADLSDIMQTSTEQSYSYTVTVADDSFAIIFDIAAIDDGYATPEPGITMPDDGVEYPMPDFEITDKTTLGFTLECSCDLPIGAVITGIVRDLPVAT